MTWIPSTLAIDVSAACLGSQRARLVPEVDARFEQLLDAYVSQWC